MRDPTEIAMMDELDIWMKNRDDPHLIVKQMLKDQTCDNCWRLAIAKTSAGDVYYCGPPQPNEPIRVENGVTGLIPPLPKERTCEYYVNRRRQGNS
jgi:hypothetical protein